MAEYREMNAEYLIEIHIVYKFDKENGLSSRRQVTENFRPKFLNGIVFVKQEESYTSKITS